MQQTIYIDNDEEISSVIDRLKKSLAKDNYIVVPRRAIFLQSIVNLKLLKREADKLKKKIVLITQDDLGMNMAQKAGVEARVSLDGVEQGDEEISKTEEVVPTDDIEIKSHPANLNKQVRLRDVGSNDFFSDNRPSPSQIPEMQPQVQPKTQPKLQPQIRISNKPAQPQLHTMGPKVAQQLYRQKLDPSKERTIEKMFQATENQEVQKTAVEEKVPVGNRTKKIFFGFVLMCLVVFSGVGLYLYVPKAIIVVTLAQQQKKVDADIKGGVDQAVEIESGKMPVRVIEGTDSLTLSYDATGSAEGTGGQKSKGVVVIQNSFSNQSQQLVATTRLESENGKIFRITKNVTVPGTTTVGGEEKPGAIEVEVVADQPGESYNIEPTTFTIPGFKDGPKYQKFKAISSKAMTGGSTSGSVLKAVTQKDIDAAKKDIAQKLADKLKENIKEKIQEDDVFLEDAMKIAVTDAKSSVKINEVRDSFDWSVSGTITAFVFSKKDVDKVVFGKYEKSPLPEAGDLKSITNDYAGVTPDFEKKTLDMRVHSVVALENSINEAELKKDFLGKNESQIETMIKKYPAIKNVAYEFQPGFIPRVPQYGQRVDLTLRVDEN